MPATGNAVSITMIDRIRVRDTEAVEHVTDQLALMTQLGVVPEMG